MKAFPEKVELKEHIPTQNGYPTGITFFMTWGEELVQLGSAGPNEEYVKKERAKSQFIVDAVNEKLKARGETETKTEKG